MGWLLVLLASVMEIVGAIGLKLYAGTKKLNYLIIFLGGFGISYLLLYFSLRYLAMSTAYAIWMGVGTSGVVVLNMIFFNEPKNIERLIGVAVIIFGIVGLKLVS